MRLLQIGIRGTLKQRFDQHRHGRCAKNRSPVSNSSSTIARETSIAPARSPVQPVPPWYYDRLLCNDSANAVLQVCTGHAITLNPASVIWGLADYAAPGELTVLPLGEPVKRCLLGPVKRFLGGLGALSLSFEAPTGEFDVPTDSFDGRVDGFEVSAAGFGLLPNGFGFPSGASGGLVIPDVVPDRVGVPASGFVFLSSRVLGVASARGSSA